jgi:serine/threonine protein kinase
MRIFPYFVANTQGYLPFDDPSIRVILRRVKKGEYHIPEAVPTDISDLIRRMLSVDPTQRPSLIEIKSHPCFRRGADENYVFPRPIPHRHFTDPIDLSSVSANVVSVLTQIGYSNEQELRSDLMMTSNNMAKVFVALLTDNLDLEKLPWDHSENVTDETFHALDYVLGGAPMSDLDFSPTLQAAGSAASFSSTVSRPDWYLEATPLSLVIESHEIQLADCEIWNLMSVTQDAVRDCGLQFFHPDPVTLYLRTRDALFYASVTATFTAADAVTLSLVLHKGDKAQFQDFKERLMQLLQE